MPLSEGPTEAKPEGFPAHGQVSGGHSQVRSQLGIGGMGAVIRAFDLKLRVGVAIRTVTALRVVRDEESATGWKLTHDPFPGWETVPTW